MKVTKETLKLMQGVLIIYIPATVENYYKRNNYNHPTLDCLLLDAWGYYVNDLRQTGERPKHLPQPLTKPLASPPSISGKDTLFYVDDTNDRTLLTALNRAYALAFPDGHNTQQEATQA